MSDSRTSFVTKYLEGRDHKQDKDSEESLWICLSTIVERSRGIIFQLVIDAVDEVMRDADGTMTTILDRIENLLSLDSSGRIRVLISNRRPPPVQFSDADMAVIDVDNHATRHNVQHFGTEMKLPLSGTSCFFSNACPRALILLVMKCECMLTRC